MPNWALLMATTENSLYWKELQWNLYGNQGRQFRLRKKEQKWKSHTIKGKKPRLPPKHTQPILHNTTTIIIQSKTRYTIAERRKKTTETDVSKQKSILFYFFYFKKTFLKHSGDIDLFDKTTKCWLAADGGGSLLCQLVHMSRIDRLLYVSPEYSVRMSNGL